MAAHQHPEDRVQELGRQQLAVLLLLLLHNVMLAVMLIVFCRSADCWVMLLLGCCVVGLQAMPADGVVPDVGSNCC